MAFIEIAEVSTYEAQYYVLIYYCLLLYVLFNSYETALSQLYKVSLDGITTKIDP